MNDNITKVLIVGAKQPTDTSGTCNTIKNIFSFLPKENLLFVTCSNQPFERIYEYNFSHYLIPIIYWLRNKFKSTANTAAASKFVYTTPKFSLSSLVLALFDVFPINFKKRTVKKIVDFKPTCIYTYGTGITTFRLALYLSKKLSVPIYVHIMDNWVDITYANPYLTLFRKKLLSALSDCLDRGSLHFTISGALTARMKNYFPNINWTELINPALVIKEKNQTRRSDKVKILYAGAITLNRWETLTNLGKSLKQCSRDIVFDAYLPPNVQKSPEVELMRNNGINVFSYVPASEIYDLYDKYDILLLVESFDTNMTGFLEFSLSTKVPEYLASGKSVVGFMPSKLYTFEFLRSNGLGHAFENDSDFVTFINNYNYNTCCNSQIDYTKRHFSIESIETKFKL